MAGIQRLTGCWRWFVLSALVGASSCSGADFVEGHVDGGGAGGDGNSLGGEPSSSDGGTANHEGGASPDSGGSVGHEGGAPLGVGGGGGEENNGGFSVVSITPAPDAIAVARDGVVDVVFSASVEKASVTATSFRVEGPLGVVEGKLAVVGPEVTFTPNKPFSLLADYTIRISSTVRGENGPLGRLYTSTFQTRDGAFSKPQRLSTTKAINFGMSGGQSGYVGVFWESSGAKKKVEVAIFNPDTNEWGAVQSLGPNAANSYASLDVALNEKGEAFASYGDDTANSPVWSRYDGVQWGPAHPEPTRLLGRPALAEDGTLMLAWVSFVGAEAQALAASLSPQNAWSANTILQQNGTIRSLGRYGAGFLALLEREGGDVYSRAFSAQGGWGTALPVTTGGVNYFHLSELDATALFTWNDAVGGIQASVFRGSEWMTTELGPGVGGTNSSVGVDGSLATWLYQKNAYGALYDEATGWGDPIKLGATTASDYGPGAAIDRARNAFAVWPAGTDITWRRLPHTGSEWSDPQQIKDQDPGVLYASVDTYGNVMLAWSNPLGVWASRFE